jgi:hypothetical protein
VRTENHPGALYPQIQLSLVHLPLSSSFGTIPIGWRGRFRHVFPPFGCYEMAVAIIALSLSRVFGSLSPMTACLTGKNPIEYLWGWLKRHVSGPLRQRPYRAARHRTQPGEERPTASLEHRSLLDAGCTSVMS